MRILITLAVLILAGCATKEPVTLKAKGARLHNGAGANAGFFAATPTAARIDARANVVTLNTSGSGGKAFQDCMSLWDTRSHMRELEWRNACQRTQYRTEDMQREADERGRTWRR